MSIPAPPQTLTFLFTDIEGSTPLWDRSPDAMRAATDRHNALLREAIAAHGGQAFRVVGDAFCVAFANAEAAVRAAIDAQHALESERWKEAPIRVRMGLHSGAAETATDEVFRGPALARAARVMAAAHGAQILVTASTVALLEPNTPGLASLRDLGDHTLRGFARPERLYQVIASGLGTEFPPIRTREALRTNLPPALTSFIGRERQLADVREHACRARMVTLVGPGGTGKTRLMVEAAAELVDAFPDGVWLTELAALPNPAQLAQTIAATLGARAEGDVPALTLVEGALAGKRSLLLLDNCEHLVDEAARVAQTLLCALPELHILATSREALGIEGEVIYRVPSLTLPREEAANAATAMESEAVRLFIERANAVTPGFALTERNVDAVAQICRRLDGIPLALELAAARLTALSVDELATRLDDRFRVLTGGRRTALPRQRTLRALVDWSYDLLSDDERDVLMTLAVFAGGFTLSTAESVCGGNAEREATVLDGIDQLVRKSLLVADHDHGHETRYRLLETIRQYAAEKLAESGRADIVRHRHFAYFIRLAERAQPELRRPTVLEWLDRLEADHDNLRAALDWAADAEPQGHARLAGALFEFWDIRGYFAEGFQRLDRAVRLYATEDTARLSVLLGCGALAYRLDQRQRSDQLLGATIALAQRLGDTRREAEATLWRARDVDFQGPDVIEPLAQRGRALSESIDDAWGIGVAIWLFGRAEMMRGRRAHAQQLFLESAAHLDRGGCVLMAALARTWVGLSAIDRQDYATARPLLEHALSEHRRLGNVHDAATTLCALGQLDLNVGRLDEARSESEESMRMFRALHDPNCGTRSMSLLAEVLHALGDDEAALRHANDAAEVAARLEFHHSRAGALWLAGRAHEAQADLDAARRAYLESLREMMQGTHDMLLPALLEAIAGTHPETPDAPQILGAAAALRDARDVPVFPSERADVDRWYEAVRTAHDAAFDRGFATGRSLPRANAIAAAMALGSPAWNCAL